MTQEDVKLAVAEATERWEKLLGQDLGRRREHEERDSILFDVAALVAPELVEQIEEREEEKGYWYA